MAETQTQWKVTWFPPDAAQRSIRGSEATVRAAASEQAEWNPIVESREVLVGDWKMVAQPPASREPVVDDRVRGLRSGLLGTVVAVDSDWRRARVRWDGDGMGTTMIPLDYLILIEEKHG